MKRFLQSNWPYLILIAALAAVFSPCLGKYILLPSPDSGPTGYPHRIVVLNQILSGKNAVAIQDILQALLPPWLFSDLTYPIDAILIAVGFGWFMRIRGANRAAAGFGGLSLALMGYSLTLFSAGHRAFFFLTLYTVLMFAFLARAICGGSLLNWPLAAMAAVWGLRFQPDFAAIYIVLAAAYSLCLVVREVRRAGDARMCRIRRLAAGAALGAVAFAAVGAPTIITTATSTLGSRMEQIESGATLPGGADGAKAADGVDEKWIFTTNWSLPPDETLEFVAPAVMGRQTGDPSLPYWGRLGRTWKWEETHQGFMNFRQHVVYLGAVPLAMALLAILVFANGPRGSDFRFDVRFWAAVWIVGLLLAFGRYTPFYRLFYAVPYLSYLRAPVKFIRLVEFSTAALAAIGATALVSENPPRRALRRFAAICGTFAALLAVFAAIVGSGSPGFLKPLKDLGADAALMSAMGSNAARALLHGVAGFALAAAVAALRARQARPIPAHGALGVLCAAAALDFAAVARPFAFTEDMEYKYTDRNIVTAAALDAARSGASPTVGLLLRDRALQRALRDNIGFHGAVAQPRESLDNAKFLAASPPGRNALLDLMDAAGCSLVLVEASQAEMLRGGKYRVVAPLAPRRPPLLLEKSLTARASGGYILAAAAEPPPYARLFARWVESSPETLLADVARRMCAGRGGEILPVVGTGLPEPSTPPGSDTADAARPARTRSIQGLDGATMTVIETDSPQDGMLLVHRPYNSGNFAWVDGKPAPQYEAGYSDTAIFVPAGRHSVKLCNEPRRPARAGLSLAALAAFFAAWALAGAGGDAGRGCQRRPMRSNG